MRWIRKLLFRWPLTREVEAVHFSDGDVSIVGEHEPPEKPQGIVSHPLRARVWRWRRAS